jgi:aspartyl-tRNA(Asn)/glutamyl-tRNA(Gln) amidotransferase subunit A
MSRALPLRPLTELAAMLASGETTSRAIIDACLARIDALNGKLHAFIEVYHDDARALADAADLERRAGAVRSPLHGLPIALKDLLHLEGRQTTAGARSWLGRVSYDTATSVEKLIAAGMIPIGKTHMVEFAFGSWGRNQPMGGPWNPWDLHTHRVAGGSSSGSAVAVAAGMVPAAIGSDTGGSIRIPSALCGITGLKPTYGLVSLYGAVPLSTTLDSIGPLAHTVEDTAMLTAMMSGYDHRDPATLLSRGRHTLPDFADRTATTAFLADHGPDLHGMRITAVSEAQFPPFVAPAVVKARAAAIAVLRKLGANVEETRLPIDLEDVAGHVGRVLAAEAYAYHREYIEDESVPIDPWVRKRILGGKGISAARYIDDLAKMRRDAGRFALWMHERDAVLTPTLPMAATPLIDVDETTAPLASFTRAVNYLGACGLSLPAGFSQEGLPVAVQLIGAPFAEGTLTRIGRSFQRATDWHRRHPDV